MNLKPIVPRPEILAQKADYINRILREAKVKDEYRPAYIGAIMLGLWKSQGSIRRDPRYVLHDINNACEEAFTGGRKTELAKSLHIDEANTKLSNSIWIIISELEKLNVVNASFAHDYLGQLYETFFRYTGGNTIGQYFTPRHIARFMADICETTNTDIVIDPACGTGGFLIACIQRAYDNQQLRYEDVIKMVDGKLLGYESEPVTAALCIANMILRGDGKTGIRKEDCFKASDFPVNKCQVALMNPPFPHKKTDDPTQKFIERALESLVKRGKLAVIVPTSLLVKKEIGKWRKRILKDNSLLSVVQLPDELFQPYSSSTTSIILFEKGVPHNQNKKTVFVRIQNDGYYLKKGSRIPYPSIPNQIPDAIDCITNKKEIVGFSSMCGVKEIDEWSPGAYIHSAIPTNDNLKQNIDILLRRLTSFYIRYAREIINQKLKIKEGQIIVQSYRDILSDVRINNAKKLPGGKGTIGEYYDIYYGQKELHSREGLALGDSLIISPTEEYNGCYGWLSYPTVMTPPFITVAQTGSIGEAFVQLEPCAVNDDCLILLPKIEKQEEVSISNLLISTAIISMEKWRFSYGRKLTPSRICDFHYYKNKELEDWVEKQMSMWDQIIKKALKSYMRE